MNRVSFWMYSSWKKLLWMKSAIKNYTNTFSIFQPNAHDVLNAYFIKYLLHVSVCYTPSSGRTSYYLVKPIPSLTENLVHTRCFFFSDILNASRNATRHRCTWSFDHIWGGNVCSRAVFCAVERGNWRPQSNNSSPLVELPNNSWNLHSAIHVF
jgi:hypothetical protein